MFCLFNLISFNGIHFDLFVLLFIVQEDPSQATVIIDGVSIMEKKNSALGFETDKVVGLLVKTEEVIIMFDDFLPLNECVCLCSFVIELFCQKDQNQCLLACFDL